MLRRLKAGADIAQFLEKDLLRVVGGKNTRYHELLPLFGELVDFQEEIPGGAVTISFGMEEAAPEIGDRVLASGFGRNDGRRGEDSSGIVGKLGFASDGGIQLCGGPSRVINLLVRIIFRENRFDEIDPNGCVSGGGIAYRGWHAWQIDRRF